MKDESKLPHVRAARLAAESSDTQHEGKQNSRDGGPGRRLEDHRSQHYVRVLDVVAFSGVPSSSTPNAGKGKNFVYNMQTEKRRAQMDRG